MEWMSIKFYILYEIDSAISYKSSTSSGFSNRAKQTAGI